ncbi:MAG: ABC transporter substrate-binding protein [Alphaproteobacteria bacterium]|nr:ABC transporter substrate-binding protein [Alphaproteobacteria bacterium]
MRIVSLIPSATEIVAALGGRADLVGRSHECDFPDGVAALPALTAPRIDLGGGSAAIHAQVARALTDGLAIYRVDLDLLAELRPDVIVTQDQCEVCAASLAQVEEAVCAVLPTRPSIVSLKPNSLADVLDDFLRVATAIGRDARDAVGVLQQRLGAASQRAGKTRPRLAFLEWIDPLMGPGLWTPELIALAGAEPVFGVAGAHTRARPATDLRDADPDIILVAPCGYTIEQSLAERHVLEGLPGWQDLAAVRGGRVAVADGNAFFNRPGPRLAESAEIVAAVVSDAGAAKRRLRSGARDGFVWLD